jgi:hypothetical protein
MEDQELDEQKHHDRFTSFMFGPRGVQHRKDYHPQDTSSNSSSIDYKELINNIDTLMESVTSLKPLVQTVLGKISKKK